MRIGIYGGTFDPIHLGHMRAAEYAAEYLHLDRLYLIPAGLPPHKHLADNTPAPEHRLHMAELAVDALSRPECPVEVWAEELRQEGKSYTVHTLHAFREQYPEDELWLLMGTDMFLTLQTWYHAEELLRLCRICAFGRSEGDTGERLAVQRDCLEQRYGVQAVTIVLPQVVDISSTAIRKGLRHGEGEEYLLPAVYGYILRHGLYGTAADLKHLTIGELRPVAMSYLKRRRVPHVLGTEETAARLARRYGAEEESARRAALLHDCTKRLSAGEQLELCRHYHIDLDEYEQREAKLLHAKTGAAVARDVFGVSDEIYWAIWWHTTGKADMTLLEKILYLADYMEPTRDFCDLRELRRLAFEDLDRALLLGFTMAVEDLSDQGMALHPNSVYARDYLKGMFP